jgi:endoglucanase
MRGTGSAFPVCRTLRKSRGSDRVRHGIEENIVRDKELNSAGRRLDLQDVRECVSSYFASGFRRKQIAADFDSVLNRTMQHGVDHRSMLLGEFDVTRTYGRYRASDLTSQEAWLRDVRTAAEP